MRQIWITRPGGPEVLQVREAPDPVPADGEILIDVKAVGVNFADVMARVGKYADAPPMPCVVGYEVAGDVLAIGHGPTGSPAQMASARVMSHDDASGRRTPREGRPGRRARRKTPLGSGLSIGDRVFAMTRFGGYSSMVCVPTAQVFRLPDDMTYAQGAAIPVNCFTAYLAMIRLGNLQPDERVLIHNAGGGVGVAAIQLARRIGAEIYGTASGWKHDRLYVLGANVLVDYTTTDWVRELNHRTGGPGMHVIIDPIGGRNLKRDAEVMAPLARLVTFGLSEPVRNGDRAFPATLRSVLSMPRPGFLRLLSHNWMVGGLNVGHLWSEVARLRAIGEDILSAWKEGFVRPEIHRTFSFDEAADAHRMLAERRNLGKVLLVP